MRTLSSALLVVFALPLAAQSVTWGVTGGATLGSPEDLYSLAAVSSIGGWTAGVTIGPRVPTSALDFRIDVSYSNLGNHAGKVLDPFPVDPEWYDARFVTAGASADLVWNVLGAGKSTSPYLLAGLGWYAAQTTTTDFFRTTTLTSGVLSYNGGLGFRFTRYFIEARAIVYRDVLQPYGASRANIYSYPVTLGLWF